MSKYSRRFLSPSMLLTAVVLFPLPWIEIRCERSRATPAPAAAGLPPLHQRISDWFRSLFTPTDSVVLITQTGLQAISGEYSLAPSVLADAEWTSKIRNQLRPDPSPLLGCCLALLCLGVAAGFVLPLGRGRTTLLVLISLSAFTILLWQTCVGFPFEQEMKSPNDREALTSTLWRVLAFLATFVGVVSALVEWWRCHRQARVEQVPRDWERENSS